MITVESIKSFVEKIKSVKHDDECAHGLEDDMYISILQAIVDDEIEDIKGVCAEALKSQKIDFSRWCA